MTAYYQPSLTEEYDEDSPGGDFDFFSNLVTKWEAAAKLPGESTRQVVVRSGEDEGPGNQAKWQISGLRRAELAVRGHHHFNWQTEGKSPKDPQPSTLSTPHVYGKAAKKGEEENIVQIFKAKQPSCTTSLSALGVVLGRGGGAISHMLLPFRLGLGGPIGSGHQFFPWIHIGDLAGILSHALEANHVQGVLNGVAPASTTTNAEFAQALGAALGRPAFIPVPSTVVQAVFGRERAIMLLEGQKVVPRRTLASGYQYSFPELGAALKDVVA